MTIESRSLNDLNQTQRLMVTSQMHLKSVFSSQSQVQYLKLVLLFGNEVKAHKKELECIFTSVDNSGLDHLLHAKVYV